MEQNVRRFLLISATISVIAIILTHFTSTTSFDFCYVCYDNKQVAEFSLLNVFFLPTLRVLRFFHLCKACNYCDGAVVVVYVDSQGHGNYTKVQDAVNSIPPNSDIPTIIKIASGVYREKVYVDQNKGKMTFEGEGYQNTRISWADTANSSGGTIYSASVTILSANFIAQDISFENTAPAPDPGEKGAQAVALRIAGDKAAFYRCGFFGAQDTLHDDSGRHYFRDCYIQGSIDFIFGNGRSLYESCMIRSTAKEMGGMLTGAITAQGRERKEERSGFSFVRCRIDGSGRILLGRAWRAYSEVVFAETYMSGIVAEEGWSDRNDTSRDRTVFFGEYRCTGPGADVRRRVPYSRVLTDSSAAHFIGISYIDGQRWLPPSIQTQTQLSTQTV